MTTIEEIKELVDAMEIILFILLKLEKSSLDGVTLIQLKEAAHPLLGIDDVYKTVRHLRSMNLIRSPPFKTIAEGELRLAEARRELAKQPSEINIDNLRLAYELTEEGRKAAEILTGKVYRLLAGSHADNRTTN